MLNRYFVPVYANNMEVTVKPPSVPPQTLLDRIRVEAVRADIGRPNRDFIVATWGAEYVARLLGKAEGSKVVAPRRPLFSQSEKSYRTYIEPGPDPVMAIIVSPQGHPIGLLRTTEILDHGIDGFRMVLEKQIARLQLKAGEPLSPPPAPSAAQGEVVLHAVGRYLGQPTFWKDKDGNTVDLKVFQQVPGEAWIRLKAASWTAFLPPVDAQPGFAWSISDAAVNPIYNVCFPPTEASPPNLTWVVSQSTRATLLEVSDGVARVSLDGKMRLRHPWWNMNLEHFCDADFKGYVDVDMAARTIKAFRMVSDQGQYYATDGTLKAQYAMAIKEL